MAYRLIVFSLSCAMKWFAACWVYTNKRKTKTHEKPGSLIKQEDKNSCIPNRTHQLTAAPGWNSTKKIP